MNCKVCNAQIADDAQVCPFCNSPVTMEVDPGAGSAPEEVITPAEPVIPETPAFPDPASTEFNQSVDSVSDAFSQPAQPIPDPVPDPFAQPAQPSAADLGLSEPAQPGAPIDPQPAPQPYMDPAGNIPNGQPVQPSYGSTQNSYGQSNYSQPNYGQTPPPTGNPYGGGYGSIPDPTSEYEKTAGTVQTLGIVALVLSIVIGFCCCSLPGPIVGIVGLVKNSKLKDNLYLVSEEGQKKANTGKILCIISIVLGVLAILANIAIMASGMLTTITEDLG